MGIIFHAIDIELYCSGIAQVMEAGEASFDELLDEQAGKPLNLSWVATYWEQVRRWSLPVTTTYIDEDDCVIDARSCSSCT